MMFAVGCSPSQPEPSTNAPCTRTTDLIPVGCAAARNTKDQREVQVSLTAKGKKLFNQSGCLTDKLIRNSGMTAEDLVSLNERVQSLRDAIKRNNNGASPA